MIKMYCFFIASKDDVEVVKYLIVGTMIILVVSFLISTCLLIAALPLVKK